MHITVYRAGGRVHIGPPGDLQSFLPKRARDSQQLSWANFYGEWEARNFFLQYFRDAYELGRLRVALASEVYDVTRWSDEDVLAAAAVRLARGVWRVAYEDDRPPAVLAEQPPPSASRSRPVRSPAAPRSAQAASHSSTPLLSPSAPARGPTSTQSAPASEWSASAVNQVAQAKTLERTARDGTPFCEICEARRKAAQEPGNE